MVFFLRGLVWNLPSYRFKIKKMWRAVLVSGLVLILDQGSKSFINSFLREGGSFPLLPFLSLTHIRNSGISFGLFQNRIPFFLPFVLFFIITLFLFFYLKKERGKLSLFSVGLIWGGMLGNLVDRIRWGEILDFLDFHFFPVFNLADSAITIGLILLFIQNILVCHCEEH